MRPQFGKFGESFGQTTETIRRESAGTYKWPESPQISNGKTPVSDINPRHRNSGKNRRILA
jgi:hypothetical protein